MGLEFHYSTPCHWTKGTIWYFVAYVWIEYCPLCEVRLIYEVAHWCRITARVERYVLLRLWCAPVFTPIDKDYWRTLIIVFRTLNEHRQGCPIKQNTFWSKVISQSFLVGRQGNIVLSCDLLQAKQLCLLIVSWTHI